MTEIEVNSPWLFTNWTSADSADRLHVFILTTSDAAVHRAMEGLPMGCSIVRLGACSPIVLCFPLDTLVGGGKDVP